MSELSTLVQEIEGLKDRTGRSVTLHFNGAQSGVVQEDILKIANYMVKSGVQGVTLEKVFLLGLKHVAAGVPDDGGIVKAEQVTALREQIEKSMKELKPQEVKATALRLGRNLGHAKPKKGPAKDVQK